MAFCPNCGTPNTDQVEKCSACGFELSSKQKGKFKGTIMMSGVKTSGMSPPVPSPSITGIAPVEAPSEPAPDVEPLPSRPSVNSAFARHSNYAKTMLGHVSTESELPELARPARSGAPGSLPSTPSAPSVSSPPSAPPRGPSDLSSTLPGRAPSVLPMPPDASAPSVDARSEELVSPVAAVWQSTPSARIPAHTPSSVDVSDRPPGPKGPSRIVLIGCAGAIAVTTIVAALLYYGLAPMIARKLGGSPSTEVQAQAWHAQLAQALTQVTDLCRDDCQKAEVFFHPTKQFALLGEAKALTPQRVLALADPSARAEMLDRTDDAPLASELALDPQQCVRVVRDKAKAISCSVPVPGQQNGELRIIHLSGIGSL